MVREDKFVEEEENLSLQFDEEELERIAELKAAGLDINESEEEEEERKAIAHYKKKREQSRKYYRLNPERCKEYNKKRVSKTKVPVEGAEPKIKMSKEERDAKNREYSKKKYHENKEANALRQKAYRLKYKIAYNRYLAKEKQRKALLTPEQLAAEEKQEEEDAEDDAVSQSGSESGSESGQEETPTEEAAAAPVEEKKVSKKRKSEIESLIMDCVPRFRKKTKAIAIAVA